MRIAALSPGWKFAFEALLWQMLTTSALRSSFSIYTSLTGAPLNSVLGRTHRPPRQAKVGDRHGVAPTKSTTEIGVVSPEPQPNTRQLADVPDSKSGPRKGGVGSSRISGPGYDMLRDRLRVRGLPASTEARRFSLKCRV